MVTVFNLFLINVIQYIAGYDTDTYMPNLHLNKEKYYDIKNVCAINLGYHGKLQKRICVGIISFLPISSDDTMTVDFIYSYRDNHRRSLVLL